MQICALDLVAVALIEVLTRHVHIDDWHFGTLVLLSIVVRVAAGRLLLARLALEAAPVWLLRLHWLLLCWLVGLGCMQEGALSLLELVTIVAELARAFLLLWLHIMRHI